MRLPDEWTVFPLHPIASNERATERKNKRLCGCGDPTCANAGKHPAMPWGELQSGRKVVAKDERAGLGLATGARSGVVVVDLDFKPDKAINGLESFAALCQSFGYSPNTLTVRTPTGGFHLYFQWPGRRVKDSASLIGPGIDIRGDGGYVVLPDTEHDCGGRYEFLNWGTPIEPLPAWLEARLAESPGRDNAPFPIPQPPQPGGVVTTEEGWKLLDKIVAEILKIPEGQRNERLFQKVAKLGDAIYAGYINVDDARYSVLKAVSEAGWGDPGKTADTVERALKGSSKGRVVICDVNHRPANDRCVELLAYDESVYVIGQNLSRDTGEGISAMSRPNLQEILSANVDFRKKDKDGNLLPVHPPPWAVQEVYDRKVWCGLRKIEGYSDVPILRPDRSVAWEKGYDSSTQVMVGRTQEEVPMTYEEACFLLRDIVCDVPFESPSHLGAWVCSVLTPLALHSFTGPVPIFVFEASMASSGKTNLANLSGLIGTGKRLTTGTYTRDETEFKKVITSHALNPKPIIFFDNVVGEFGGAALSALVTSTDRTWRDRILGGNAVFEGRINSAMFVTANQIRLAPDLESRICPVRVTPFTSRPDRRSGFKYDPWLQYAERNQQILTWAALKILQGPKAKVSGWRSYTEWRDLVVGSVVAAGFADPSIAVDAMREMNSESLDDSAAFVEGWKEACDVLAKGAALRVKDVWDACYPSVGMRAMTGCEKMREWIEGAWPKGEATKNRFSQRIKRYKDTATDKGTLRYAGVKDGYTYWLVK